VSTFTEILRRGARREEEEEEEEEGGQVSGIANNRSLICHPSIYDNPGGTPSHNNALKAASRLEGRGKQSLPAA
jgi:hypothetical protein